MDRQIESLNFNLQRSTAIITYASTLTFKNSGKEMRSINSETWTHADGKWLCLHSHTSQFAAEQMDIWILAGIIGTNAILALEFDDVEMDKEVLATLKAKTNIYKIPSLMLTNYRLPSNSRA